MNLTNPFRFIGGAGATYDDWHLPAFNATVRWRSNVTTLNTALAAIPGANQLLNHYYTSTEASATRFRTRWMTANSTGTFPKANGYRVRYVRREVMADTSGFAVGDQAFGGMVYHVETNVQLHIMTLQHWNASEWADDTTNLLGATDNEDGLANTNTIVAATTTSVAQDALDYEN